MGCEGSGKKLQKQGSWHWEKAGEGNAPGDEEGAWKSTGCS